jgi:hypothetical protein
VVFYASMSELPPAASHDHSLTRRDYMTTEGCVLVADVNQRLMRDLIDTAPAKSNDWIEARPADTATYNPAGISLYAATESICLPFKKQEGRQVAKNYGVSDSGLDTASRFFEVAAGFGDLDFSWRFAPAIANAVAWTFLDKGIITADQHHGLTLTDWANVIGTGWFAQLAESLAYTHNGVYRSFGSRASHYNQSSFQTALRETTTLDAKDDLFDVSEQVEPNDGYIYHTATISEAVCQALRRALHRNAPKQMRRNASPGCPGARHTISLYPHMIETDPHVASLIGSGIMQVVPERSNERRVMVRQEYSAIEIALATLAFKLQHYENLYGTPKVEGITTNGVYLTHAQLPPTEAIRYPQPQQKN